MSIKLKHQGSIRMKRKWTEDWSGKQLHGQFKWETEDLSGVSWNWLRTGELKNETEGLIFAAQDQALRIHAVKSIIPNKNVSSKCRMCGSHDETVQHILCSFPKLAQKEYKERHAWCCWAGHTLGCVQGIWSWVQWQMVWAFSKSVKENEEVKLLWDSTIQTDLKIHHRRPDLVIQKKKAKETIFVDYLFIRLFPEIATYCRKKLKGMKSTKTWHSTNYGPGKRD